MWLVTLFSLAGVWLNIKKRRSGFALWCLTNSAWGVYDYRHGLYPQAVLFAVYVVLACYGWIAWAEKDG